MAFVEVLIDGLTLGGRVRRAGDLVNAPGFKGVSRADQVKRWGEPRYKEISEKDFNERGGNVDDVAVAVELTPPELPAQEPVAGEFDVLDDLDVDATLDAVAAFDEATLARFVDHEKAGKGRKGVLRPLGVEIE